MSKPSVGLPDVLQHQPTPVSGNGDVQLELLKTWFHGFSKAVSSEINELKDKVIAQHEEIFNTLALEKDDKFLPLVLENEQLECDDLHVSVDHVGSVPQTPKTVTVSDKWDHNSAPSKKVKHVAANEKFEVKSDFGTSSLQTDVTLATLANVKAGRRTVKGMASTRSTKQSARVASADRDARTKKLFARLARDADIMPAARVYNILRLVHGPNCPMGFDRVQKTLDLLYLAVYGADLGSTIGSSSPSPGRESGSPRPGREPTSPRGVHNSPKSSAKSRDADWVNKSSGEGRSRSSRWGWLRGSIFPRASMGSTLVDYECHNGMDCELFLRLMQWDKLYSTLEENFAVDCYVIRDALIKHGADLVIAFHARLDLPEAVEEKPFMMQVIEPVSALAIMLNALTIGLSTDTNWDVWETCELMFTCFFALEIAVKFYYNGVRIQLFGPERYWNYFDILLVGLAVADLLIQKVVESDDFDMRDFTLARLARLAKVTRLMRLLRLLRLRIFKELLLMVRGVFAGLRTLFWAIVLLLFFVYACSVAMMQTVGEANINIGDQYETVLFHSLLWSMFNVFRCFMSDGSLPDGTSLVGHLEAKYGASFVLPYTFAYLFIVFGIFNLIAAIFVENVMASARAKRELTEDGERVRVALALRQLLLKFCGVNSVGKIRNKTVHMMQTWSLKERIKSHVNLKLRAFTAGDEYNLQQGNDYFEVDGVITRDMFANAIKDQETWHLLDDLEIHCDRTELFDVLDADNSGEIDIYEMISGLMKMRSGGADKSDGVATILSLRAVQNSLRKLEAESSKISKAVGEVQELQEMVKQTSEDAGQSLLGSSRQVSPETSPREMSPQSSIRPQSPAAIASPSLMATRATKMQL